MKPGDNPTPARPGENFELFDMDGGDLLGIFAGVHAVPGAVMLLHTTVGCKFKTQLQLADHDWGRESHNQRLWTGVDDARIIKGSGRRLVEFATTWYQRRKPEMFVVATNASIELSAFDVEAAVDELRMRLPIPILYLKAPGHEGSIQSGYRRFMQAVAPMLSPASMAPDAARSVALGGYFLDRYEMEHAANVGEIRRLLGQCGLSWRGAMFDGSPWESVLAAGSARNFIWLPYGHGVASVCGVDDRTHCETDLPVGLTGTSVFLDRIGQAFGLDSSVIDGVRDRELSRVVPLIRRALGSIAGRRVAVFLDTPSAAAVVSFLTELGCEVPLVCLTDGTSGSEHAFFDACARLGACFESGGAFRPVRPRVLAGRSHNTQYLEFQNECRNGFISVVFGSSIQSAALESAGVQVIEMGFPSVNKHWLYPVPWMGYNGAVALVQRLLDTFRRVH